MGDAAVTRSTPKTTHSMHHVSLQLVHQGEIDRLLLDSHTFLIYNTARKEP